MKSELKYYTSIYKIPVLNWHFLNENSDMNYLLIADDYNNIPEHNINLGEVYLSLISQLPHADTYLQTLWIEAKKIKIQFMAGKLRRIAKLHQVFTRYRNQLDEIFHNFRYRDKIYKSTNELFMHIKSISKGKHELIYNQYAAFDLDSINAEPVIKSSILSELSSLSQFFGYYLDPNTVSVGMFYNMRASAMQQIKNRK